MSTLNRVEQLFQAALDLASENRLEFLRDACKDNEALLSEVLALLDADASDDSFLDRPLLASSTRPHHVHTPGERIGPYRIVDEIGSGGMGAVYLAERADQTFHQRVALKVIKNGVSSEHLLKRFESERQILARLQHPNIARLLDGGVTEDDLPYFTMEFVEGEPIDRYCDRLKLSIRQRLKLFQAVCSAVSYAHRNLVVHRDLKPANILVQEDGIVKLLDFGIAKFLDVTDSAIPTNLTITAQRLLTPDYASPEQIRGESVAIATDIYQLGINLYELLTGQRPHHFDTSSFAEIERIIYETEVSKPSTAVVRVATSTSGSGHDSAKTISKARGCEPNQLRRQLNGDLDNICLMALRKEPERRYASVDNLAQDITRYLTGRPVTARPSTFAYRTQKFVKRNQVALASISLMVFLLSFMMMEIVDERDNARQEASKAMQEASKAMQIAEFVIDLFEVNAPSKSLGETISVKELLERGAERIDEDLAGQPEVQATMLHVVGRVYHSLGRYQKAIAFQERALAIRRQIHGKAHEEIAESLYGLANAFLHNYDAPLANQYLKETLAMRRLLAGNEDTLVAKVLDKIAGLERIEGKYKDAIAHQEEALAIRRARFAEPNVEIAHSLHHLAKVLMDSGKLDQAEPLFFDALNQYRELLPDEHPDILLTLNNLALLYERRGDYGRAIEQHRQRLAVERKVLGEEHPNVATGVQNLAYALACNGAYDESGMLYQEAITLRRKIYGEKHAQVAWTLNIFGDMLTQKGDYRKAESVLLEGLRQRQNLYEAGDWRIAFSKQNLALALSGQGDYDNAKLLLHEAVAGFEKRFGEEQPRTAKAMSFLANVLQRTGDYETAAPLYRKALSVQRKQLAGDHPDLGITLTGLGQLLTATGLTSEAQSPLREALAIRQKRLPAEHIYICETASALGFCLLKLGKLQEAESLLVSSHEILQATREPDDYYAQQTVRRLLQFYESCDQVKKAERYRKLLATNM
ncbi:MAG: serine/threonine-protein kinase [Calditrichaeota bacterium]|nr:serine/threonine-protein kinase [Calditrichota bacterium]